jgi:restriction system protein
MLPVLRFVGDGEDHSTEEMRERISGDLKLTPDELGQKLKSGNTGLFANRLAWAVAKLKEAEILSASRRGVYRMTDRGKALLEKNPSKITIKTLLVGLPKDGYPQLAGSQPKELEALRTPEEQFENSFLTLRRALANDLLDAVQKVSPKNFEQIVVDLLIAMGYGGALEDAGEVVGKSGDGGIDGTIKQDKLGLDMVYIQAKRWGRTVGTPDVSQFSGSLLKQNAQKGVMITTSQFSKEAREHVKGLAQKLVLIDGKQLAELMIEHDVGVQPASKKSYTLKRLDQEYFEAFDS